MSDLYLDEIEKIKYYKQRIAAGCIEQGIVASKEKIQAALDTIDTKLAILQQQYIASGSQMDPAVFNQQKQDIYQDLSILYRVLYILTNERVEKAQNRMRLALDDLRLKAKEFQFLTDSQAIAIYGNVIFNQANNFEQEYDNGQVLVKLGQVAIPSGSYIAPLFSCDDIDPEDVVFKFSDDLEVPAYNANRQYVEIQGEYKLDTEYHSNSEKSFGSGTIAMDDEVSNINQYNIFLNKNKILVRDLYTGGQEYVAKESERYYTATELTEVSFYIYGATNIHFDIMGNLEYTNFSGNEISSPAMRQKIVLRGTRFSFDVKTDGILFAEKESAIINNGNLMLHRTYEDIDDYMIEKILYGEDVVYDDVTVIIKNAESVFYDIKYITIKQIQISELEDKT